MPLADDAHSPRCWTCGYLLTGLATPRCPECGRAFDPADPATMNLRGPPRWLTRVLIRPVSRLTVLLAVVATAVIAWEARFPHLPHYARAQLLATWELLGPPGGDWSALRAWLTSPRDLQFVLDRWEGIGLEDLGWRLGPALGILLVVMAWAAVRTLVSLVVLLITRRPLRPYMAGRRLAALVVVSALGFGLIFNGWSHQLAMAVSRPAIERMARELLAEVPHLRYADRQLGAYWAEDIWRRDRHVGFTVHRGEEAVWVVWTETDLPIAEQTLDGGYPSHVRPALPDPVEGDDPSVAMLARWASWAAQSGRVYVSAPVEDWAVTHFRKATRYALITAARDTSGYSYMPELMAELALPDGGLASTQEERREQWRKDDHSCDVYRWNGQPNGNLQGRPEVEVLVQRKFAAVPPLRKALVSPDPGLQARAAVVLGDIGPDAAEAESDLVGLLASPHLDVVRAAAYGLAKIWWVSPAAVEPLCRAGRHSDDYVRSRALRALRNAPVAGDRVLPLYREALAIPDNNVRAAALTGLSDLKSRAAPAIPDLLASALQTGRERVRGRFAGDAETANHYRDLLNLLCLATVLRLQPDHPQARQALADSQPLSGNVRGLLEEACGRGSLGEVQTAWFAYQLVTGREWGAEYRVPSTPDSVGPAPASEPALTGEALQLQDGLYRAIRRQNFDGMRNLVNLGAQFSRRRGLGEALMLAVIGGDADLVDRLLREGANPNYVSSGHAVLYRTAQGPVGWGHNPPTEADYIRIADLLIAAGGKDDFANLARIAEEGKFPDLAAVFRRQVAAPTTTSAPAASP